MALLNKEKWMQGFGKAVDVVNDTADKTGRYIKEKEWDKRAVEVISSVENGVEEIGKEIKSAFSGK